VRPEGIEFREEGDGRLHRRWSYARDAGSGWSRRLLWP
jgi:pyridoxine/pyridoxamine 5'-phosphate oxidase